jgi:hypothetical protein
MARPEDHYVALVNKSNPEPSLLTRTPCGRWVPVDDPENPPPGMMLMQALTRAAALVRGHFNNKSNVVVVWRQSDGSYFPVALVETNSISLLFDPGKPRLTLTKEGKRALRKAGLQL